MLTIWNELEIDEFNRFLWARNDKAADQKRLIHYQSLRDSKMAAAPGSVFLAHFKDCIR